MSVSIKAGLVIIGLWFGGVPGVGGVATEAWSFYVVAAVVGVSPVSSVRSSKNVFKPSI